MRVLVDVPRREVAGDGQAGPHGPLGVGRDEAGAGAGRFADDDRVADVDVEFVELGLVEQAVAVVADAADERPPAAELREGDDGIGDRPAADQPRLVVVELRRASAACSAWSTSRMVAALESERGEVDVVEFEEDVDEGVAQAAEVEGAHAVGPVSTRENT